MTSPSLVVPSVPAAVVPSVASSSVVPEIYGHEISGCIDVIGIECK